MSNAKKLMQAASGVSTGGKSTAIVTSADRAVSIDISDANNMAVLDTLTIECVIGHYATLDATNNLVFCTGLIDDNVAVVDISDVNNLVQRQSYKDVNNLDFTHGVVCDPDAEVVFVGSVTDNQITVIDYSNPSSLSHNSALTTNSCRGLAIDTVNHRLYGGRIDFRSFTYNGSTGALTQADFLSTHNVTRIVLDLVNNDAYCVGDSVYLFSIDLTDINNLSLNSTYTFASGTDLTALAIDVEDQVVLALDTDAGKLYSVDVSDPTNKTLLDTLTDTTDLQAANNASIEVDTERKIAFMVARTPHQKIVAIDYSDSSNLSKISTLTNSNIRGSGLVLLD